ncbi:MAG TPA: DsbA family protein [Longimicrobiales bacterium]|nr:DsbA family protein [Longimicrobiales bacterium]
MHATRATPTVRFYFDFVDPLSYLLELELERAEAEGRARVEAIGFELRPPPAPLTELSDPLWAPRWREARRRAPDGARLEPPRLVPWTRKALELHAFARERGLEREARRALFAAHFAEGRDIGRVDVLVEVARALGFDRTEAKVTLDVDRYRDEVEAARRRAEELGVTDVPALGMGERLVRGFPGPGDLGTLLG